MSLAFAQYFNSNAVQRSFSFGQFSFSFHSFLVRFPRRFRSASVQLSVKFWIFFCLTNFVRFLFNFSLRFPSKCFAKLHALIAQLLSMHWPFNFSFSSRSTFVQFSLNANSIFTPLPINWKWCNRAWWWVLSRASWQYPHATPIRTMKKTSGNCYYGGP